MLLPIGLAYFAIYYGVFRFVIRAFDLKTPGRDEDDADDAAINPPLPENGPTHSSTRWAAPRISSTSMPARRALRLVVADQSAVSEDALKRLGARGVVRPSANALQVVLGPIADQVAGEIRAGLHATARRQAPVSQLTAVPRSASNTAVSRIANGSATPEFDASLTAKILAALGGRSNIRDVQAASSRLVLELADGNAVSEPALQALGIRGIARPATGRLHLIIGPSADAAYAALTSPA